MSESRFDNAVETAWGTFESWLEASLAALGDESIVIENDLADDLALRTGGKAFFNSRPPRSGRSAR